MGLARVGTTGRCAALAALVLIVYAGSLDNGFHFDDHHSIELNPAVRSLAAIPSYFVDAGTFSADPDVSMYRPLLLVTFALNHALGGGAFGYHVGNVLLHAAFVVVLFVVGRRLTGRPDAMWWAAAWLAVHPVDSQAVNYVSSRSGILAALGAVAALHLASVAGRGRPLPAAASQLAGLLAKSTALAGAGLVLLFEARRDGPRRWGAVAAVGAACAVYVVAARASGFYATALDGFVRPLATQALTQCKALAYYVYLCASPVRLSLVHPFAESSEPSAAVVGGALLSASLLVLGAAGWRRGRRSGFGLLWFYGGLAVTTAMPLFILVSEQRLYLSLAGLAVAAAALWRAPRALPPAAIPAALVAVSAVLAAQRTAVWQDELTLWLDAARQAPASPRVWAGVGEAWHARGDGDRAVDAFRRALALRPDDETTWNNLGVAHEAAGRADSAAHAYGQALGLRPDWPVAQANLGRLLLHGGQAQAAAPLLARAAARSPSAAVLVNLGAAAAAAGDREVAKRAFEDALALDAGNLEARLNLAALALDAGRPEAAAQGYLDILRDHPGSAAAHLGYGRVLLAAGDSRAADELRQGIETGAASARDWQDLGRAEAGRRRWSAAAEAFGAAARQAPADPAPAYNLGEVCLQQWQALRAAGQAEAARDWYLQALRAYRGVEAMAPDYRAVRSRIAELEASAP